MTGLCSTCSHAKEMRNDRGSCVSVFTCLLSRTFDTYGIQNIRACQWLRCEGYERLIVLAGKTEDEAGKGKRSG